jgi:cell division transport system ATP-binding protein
MLSKAIIRCKNVSLHYDDGPNIFKDISLTLLPKSFHFITGVSGAGKTSLLRMFYLAAKPSTGLVSIFGQDASRIALKKIPAIRRQMGIVFQNFGLFDHLTALENVALPLRIGGARLADIKPHVEELLDWVGLSHQKDTLPTALSGGEQQRVTIARAVITRPKLLMADEPTGNVDDDMGLKILHLFEELNRIGTTVIVATHNEHLVSKFPYPRLHLENKRLSLISQQPREDHAQDLEKILATAH